MKPARVLIVEDDRTVQELARIVLEEAGYEVRSVTTGEDALIHIMGDVPDVVLMDRDLPGMSGLELTRLLKLDARTGGSIVLAFTARVTPADDAMSVQAGSDGFVGKPFDVDGLLRTVAWHLSIRAARSGNALAPGAPSQSPPRRPVLPGALA